VSSSGHGKATIHRLHYAEGKFALGTILAAVIPRDSKLVSARFLFEYLSAFKDELLVSRMIGTANVSLSVGKIAEVPVPVVEFSVQRKVDELMALCDQLEAARTERETARDRLSAASLARLNAPDPETFQSGAHFALNVLPALSARPDQVKQLRQTILNLAVRGKLVEQDPADEPASELLRRVSSGRRLGSAEQLRRDEGELGAARPRGWEHVAWSQVCDFVTSGSRGWAEYYATSGAWFIRAQNIRFGSLLLDNLACVRPPKSAEGSRTQVRKDDLLIVITGAGVTNPALLDRDLGEAYISQHVALVRPNYGQLSRWLLLCLMADESGRAELVRCAYGSGKPGLNLDNIRTLQSPLPPLAEQHRIVAKVDELMALCDQLEASITAGESTQSRLLDALLHDATVSTEVAV
jgi:type I restriction enzyme S subunit